MKAKVKMPYYDTELHRKGEIVEVKALNRYVEALPEIKEPKITAEKIVKRSKNVRKG